MNNDKRKMRHRNISAPFTRTEYINRIPQGKEKDMKWTYGDCNKSFPNELKLVSTNIHYLSVNSLDAVRIAMTHVLGSDEGFYFMQIHPYPHIFLREHGLLGVAKAERMAKGMKHSFGKPSTRVALVRPNQQLITLRVNDDLLKKGRSALEIAGKKLACGTKIEERHT